MGFDSDVEDEETFSDADIEQQRNQDGDKFLGSPDHLPIFQVNAFFAHVMK